MKIANNLINTSLKPSSDQFTTATMKMVNNAAAAATTSGGYKDAESIFRSKPIAEIRTVFATTQDQILAKKEELRQLVGNRYRDLIDSADSIVAMNSISVTIAANISAVKSNLLSLSDQTSSATSSVSSPNPNPNRIKIYGIACRVKYLVDTPENIWGCLDESMFLEAAARYARAKHVQCSLGDGDGVVDAKILSNFPLLQHQLQIVESFRVQISQRSRERLLDRGIGIGIDAYADALAAVAVIDEMDPMQVLTMFLDSRKSWISSKLVALSGSDADSISFGDVVSVFCDVMRVIQVSLGQVGMFFLRVLNDMPLFYKVILSSPPASQLFGGIPNPNEEVRLWKMFRDKLESVMVMLDRDFIAKTCSDWLRDCGELIVGKVNGKHLIEAIGSGEELALAEKSIHEAIDSKEVLEGCLEWLKSVFGSEIELPWSRIREVVLKNDADLWDEIFEEAFVKRTKVIIDSGFEDLANVVNIKESIRAIGETQNDQIDLGYLNKSYMGMGGGVWFTEPNFKNIASISSLKALPVENDFRSCLDAYFGPEVSRIRDAVDSRCQSILEDVLRFLESPKAPLRLKDLASYLQNQCYGSMSNILLGLKNELDYLYASLDNRDRNGESLPPSIIVNKSLFIGRLLFALQNHSRHIPVILGSPRLWVNESVVGASDKIPSMLRHTKIAVDSPMSDRSGRHMFSNSRRQTSLAASALLGVDDSASANLKEFSKVTRELCIKAHNLWISWVSDDLSAVLSLDLRQDDGLSATTPLRGWEETVVKQDQSHENQSEMKISLPSMPSLYITSFLFRACAEIHQVGGHVLDKVILQNFSLRLMEKVISIYGDFLTTTETLRSQVSEKGVLQLLLDIQFVVDVLSGGDVSVHEDPQRSPMTKSSFRRKQDKNQIKSVSRDRISGLVHRLSLRLDPIDWLTYEPYLWENERQSYLRHAVLFGFFIQLNRMYTDTVQKLPTNSESNIMRCSTIPRFKYLPISAPELSRSGSTKLSVSTSSEDISSRSSWKAYSSGDLSPKVDFDENSSFGVATPFLKSFMQVGSRFGESTMKLGSILTDGQVGSRFGDMLPVQAAGLLSSFTATRSDS